MQQIALAAIDHYINQPAEPSRRRAVPVDELFELFSDLPPMDPDRFRSDQEKYVDGVAHFDTYLRDARSGDAE